MKNKLITKRCGIRLIKNVERRENLSSSKESNSSRPYFVLRQGSAKSRNVVNQLENGSIVLSSRVKGCVLASLCALSFFFFFFFFFKTSVSVLGFEVTLIKMFKPGSYFTSILKCYIGSHSSLSGTWNVRHAICLVLPAQAIERFDPFSRCRRVLICILPFL